MSRLRVGLVTHWGDSGAGYVSRAYCEMALSAHDVFIFARGGSKSNTSSMWHEPYVHWARRHPCTTGVSLREFRRWATANRLDVVIFNEQRWWEPVIEAQRLGLLTGAYIDYYTADTVSLFQLYDFVICNTKRHQSVFRQHAQCVFIPWGTDVATFRPGVLQAAPQHHVVFFANAGRGGANARTDPALDRRGTEFAILAMAGVSGNCKLVIHSQCSLTECPEKWQRLIAADHRIEFIHMTVGPPGLYARGTVYLYPSRLDGIGLTLPEALSCGLPAIVTDSAPMTEFVDDGVNGSVVRVEKVVCRHDAYYWPESLVDIHHLSTVMQEYISNPEQAYTQGVRARELALRNLDWSRNAAVLPTVLANLKKVVKVGDQSAVPLLAAARLHDRRHEPTPWQQCLGGLRRGAHHLAACGRELL